MTSWDDEHMRLCCISSAFFSMKTAMWIKKSGTWRKKKISCKSTTFSERANERTRNQILLNPEYESLIRTGRELLVPDLRIHLPICKLQCSEQPNYQKLFNSLNGCSVIEASRNFNIVYAGKKVAWFPLLLFRSRNSTVCKCTRPDASGDYKAEKRGDSQVIAFHWL